MLVMCSRLTGIVQRSDIAGAVNAKVSRCNHRIGQMHQRLPNALGFAKCIRAYYSSSWILNQDQDLQTLKNVHAEAAVH